MPLTVGDRPVRPLSADEVLRMVDAGILPDAPGVELLDGVLTEKPVKSPAHETVKSRLNGWLHRGRSAAEFLVRIEAPLVVRDRLSLPEPDVAVVEPRDYTAHHPTSALLVIEAAVTSLNVDLAVKPRMYAAAGVPELWVVDVDDGRVERFTEPDANAYARRETIAPPERVRPLMLAGVEPLDLAELFAGLPPLAG